MIMKKDEWIAVSHTGMGWSLRQFIKMKDGQWICKAPSGNAPVAWNFHRPLADFIKDNEGLK